MLSVAYFLYGVLLFVLSPIFLFFSFVYALFSKARWQQFWARLGVGLPKNRDGSRIWLHAASAGEVAGVFPIIAELSSEVPLLLTVTSVSGYQYARKRCDQRTIVSYAPLDYRWVIARFYRKFSPVVVAVTETELWPNFFRCAKLRNIPLLVINGRIYERDLNRYRLLRPFWGLLLRQAEQIFVQDLVEQQRFLAIGASPDAVEVGGNSKFDQASKYVADGVVAKKIGAPLVVVGSLHKEEEALLFDALAAVLLAVPAVTVVVAPRDLRRSSNLLSRAKEAGFKPVLYACGQLEGGNCIVLNVMGELLSFYARAQVAIIGGSFSRKVQGHNPLEAAMFGVPVLLGPYMANFRLAKELLLRNGSAKVSQNSSELATNLLAWLTDANDASKAGQAGKKILCSQKGAAIRYAKLLQDRWRVS